MWGVSEGWTQIVNCMLKQKSLQMFCFENQEFISVTTQHLAERDV